MDQTIALILVQDGVVNGAIYALLSLSLVLVFTVTRVIFVPQGELVAFGALTYALLDAGVFPGSVFLLGALGIAAFLAGWAQRRISLGLVLETLVLPVVVGGLTFVLAGRRPGVFVEAALALAIVAPMAPYLYRVAFQPLAQASVLVLLIASVGVHLALVGLGLVFFGPEGSRASGFSEARFSLGPMLIQGQALWIIGLTGGLMAALYVFFSRSLSGKALRATAVNRLGRGWWGLRRRNPGGLRSRSQAGSARCPAF